MIFRKLPDDTPLDKICQELSISSKVKKHLSRKKDYKQTRIR